MKNLLLIAITILAVGCGGKDESTTEIKPVEEKVLEVKEEAVENKAKQPNYVDTLIQEKIQEVFNDFKSKAERGDAYAQVNLGWHYENGEGVSPDSITAYAWFDITQLNINGGYQNIWQDVSSIHESAKQGKDNLSKKMTVEQINKARELSKEMIKKNAKLIFKRLAETHPDS